MVHIMLAVVLAGAGTFVKADPDTPELLILGSPHFGNHNRDIANSHVEDIRTPERQREIEAVVEQLASFRPTRVAVEWSADQQTSLDQRYADYRRGTYALSSDEIDQIGLRLAAKLGLRRVDAVNWLADNPGTDSDYDFIAWLKAHGRGEEWRAFQKHVQGEADAGTELMTCTPVSSWLRRSNTPANRSADQRSYYEIAKFGDQAGNPGAAWVGAWYARNLRILNNLRAIAHPHDRVLLVIGGGHGFLLDQQARESGAFRIVETLDYLPTSPRDSWTHCHS